MKDSTNKGYWQKIAKIYAPLMESDKKFYADICEKIRVYLKPDMNVLELACGSGQLSVKLADSVNNWIATDFSEKMIEHAKKRTVSDKLSFYIADATNLSYGDSEFDCVVISNALHIMPEPEKAMSEICRVIKPGGILYAPTFLWVEGKASKTRRKMMSLTGFKTYREWDRDSFATFITEYGFKVEALHLIDGGLAPVGALVATKE